MMKRIKLHFFTALTMALLALFATAHDFEVDGIYYNIINNTEAAVTYKGTGYYDYSNEYTGPVNIPATVIYGGTTYTVTSIGWGAFLGCTELTSATIPNSVSSIGWYAFKGCTGLTSITIPNSVIEIGSDAFRGCTGLTNITIPNSVTTILSGAFYGTAWFNNQPDGLVYAGRVAYKYKGPMPSGTSINIIEGTVSISSSAFYGYSGLSNITIPNSVTTINSSAFSGCTGLTSINIGNSVTEIDWRAFYGCSGLTSVTIPNSVTSIGEGAFSGCSGLTSITIPNSVTTIGNSAFSGCSDLTSVTCLATTPPTIGSNSYYAFPSGVTSQATLHVPMESLSAYQSAYNWMDFSQIVGITYPDFEVEGVWYRALDGKTVKVIQRPEDEEYYQGDVVIPEEVTYEGYTFTVTSIDEGAFEDCYELNSVVIGDAVESIGENAFQGCTDLTSVTIGSGMTTIGAKAFNYCNALQTVTCLGTVPPVMANSNCFSTAAYSRAILKVPRPEIETYTATDYWYKFSHIEGWGYLGPGDVNGSGTIDMDDLTRLINIMLTDDLDGIDPSWADVTGNGIVSMNDLTELINLLLTQ